MKKWIPFLLIAVLALIPMACAKQYPTTPGAATTAPPRGILQEIQYVLHEIFTKPVSHVIADATATLATIQADLTSGKITQLTASQRTQCPQNILTLVQAIQGQLNYKIPDGAAFIWLNDQINNMSQQQLSGILTQVKLIEGSCLAQLKLLIPGVVQERNPNFLFRT